MRRSRRPSKRCGTARSITSKSRSMRSHWSGRWHKPAIVASCAREVGASRRADVEHCESDPPRLGRPTMIGSSPAMQRVARADRTSCRDRRNRADLRRERHRQGTGRADDSCAEPASGWAAGQPQLPGPLGAAHGKRTVRPQARRVHRRRGRSHRPLRSWPTAARSCSTKSPRSTSTCKPSCSACCKSDRSSASARAKPCRSTCA